MADEKDAIIGVNVWIDEGCRINAVQAAKLTTYHYVQIGTGPADAALWVNDPVTCYRLAGAFVTLAKVMERAAAERRVPDREPDETAGEWAARVADSLDAERAAGEVGF